jgi:hypothetical protein
MNLIKAIFVVTLLSMMLMACGGAETSDDKIAVVEKYITATNAQDWEEAAKYLAEDVVFTTPTGNCTGREACLPGLERPDREEPSNFSVDGNIVRWEMIVTFPDFQTPAKGEAVVENGKIQSYSVTAL